MCDSIQISFSKDVLFWLSLRDLLSFPFWEVSLILVASWNCGRNWGEEASTDVIVYAFKRRIWYTYQDSVEGQTDSIIGNWRKSCRSINFNFCIVRKRLFFTVSRCFLYIFLFLVVFTRSFFFFKFCSNFHECDRPTDSKSRSNSANRCSHLPVHDSMYDLIILHPRGYICICYHITACKINA